LYRRVCQPVMRRPSKNKLPDAEVAEVSQRTQKKKRRRGCPSAPSA
jgi:hypothetical protein